MKISIVITNFNGFSLLEKNLPKVINASQNPKNNICEIIVVDDFSNDKSVDLLVNTFKDSIKIIKHTKNRGFSASVNTGVRATKGDIICLLNTDVIPEVNFLESVQENFNNKKLFALSLHERGCGPARGYFDNGFIQIGSKAESENLENSFYVSGGSGLFRKNIWQELGGMDEALLSPFYWEDIDLCFRAAKRGYINMWTPFSKVLHNNESIVSKHSPKYVARIRERNQLLMLWKNIHSKILMTKHINGIIKRILKTPGYTLIVIMALSKLTLVLRLRKREIKECRVSDEAVFSQYS